MEKKIIFADKTHKRLISASSESSNPFSGLLIGLGDAGSDLVIGHYSFEQPDPKHIAKQFESAVDLIPLGYHVSGFFFKSPQSHLHNVVRNLCKKVFPDGSPQQKCFDPKNSGRDVLIAVLDEGSRPDVRLHRFNPRSQVLSVAFEAQCATDEELQTIGGRFALCRLQARLPFSFHHTSNADDMKFSVEKAMSSLAHQVTGWATCFRVSSGSKQLLLQGRSKISKICHHFDLGNNSSVDDKASKRGVQLKKGGVNSLTDQSKSLLHELLKVEVLVKMTGVDSIESETCCLSCVPVLYHDHMKYSLVKMDLPLDILMLLDLKLFNDDDDDDDDNDDDDDDDDDDGKQEEGNNCIESLFSNAIKKQLRSFSNSIITSSRNSTYRVPKPHHFFVPDTHLIVTVIYPEGIEDGQLESRRRELHDRFLVPRTFPVFKRPNRIPLDSPTSAYLVDVHVGLPPSKADGKVSLARGSYEYRHYMQDRLDDDGWGCAYRSLQTIASWLLLQGFTEKAPPTHKEIQKALVEVGDKPLSFLDSKQWIGSTEVSYVLDHLYQVQSKIVHVSSGGEMTSRVREMAHHFETQGTPIMIGGGVLAHTIIGVDFNEDSGDVSYLILDPHYTGPEDVKVIQSKGWCGWKGADFWKERSFYNMCMPLRPRDF